MRAASLTARCITVESLHHQATPCWSLTGRSASRPCTPSFQAWQIPRGAKEWGVAQGSPASYRRREDPTPASSRPLKGVRAPGMAPVDVRWMSLSLVPFSTKLRIMSGSALAALT